MKYRIDVLEKMIDIKTRNIEMFSDYEKEYDKDYSGRLAEMVYERRVIAATIENGGCSIPGADIDMMFYSANLPDADTSWW